MAYSNNPIVLLGVIFSVLNGLNKTIDSIVPEQGVRVSKPSFSHFSIKIPL